MPKPKQYRLPEIAAPNDHSLHSSYREVLLEHLFIGEIMRHAWTSGLGRLDVLKPQVDDGGYDLVLELARKGHSVVRHIQLKSTSENSKVARFTINKSLAQKLGGCVIVLIADHETLNLRSFLWFGSDGDRPLDLSNRRNAKHAKGDAQGVKHERPNICVVPRGDFQPVDNIADLTHRLFGTPAMP